MAFKRTNQNPKEVIARKRQAENGISWSEVAAHMGVQPSAVNMRLKRGHIDPIMKAFQELEKQTRIAS